MKPNSDILRIIAIMDFRHQPHTIKKTRVLAWFESSDRNVLGAATDAILKNWDYIQPSLTQRDLGGVPMKNFLVSLDGDNDELSVYAYTCHEAARVFCDWTLEAYSESSGQMAEEHVRVAKQLLAEKYRAGDERQRNCIVAGALEHIFEIEEMRGFFADWKNDPTLANAYKESEAWASWAARRARSLQSVALGIAQVLERSDHQGVSYKVRSEDLSCQSLRGLTVNHTSSR